MKFTSTQISSLRLLEFGRSQHQIDATMTDWRASFDDLVRLQTTAKTMASTDQVVSGLSRSVRDKLVRLEVQLIKTLDAEARAEQVCEIIAAGGPTELETPSPADARKVGGGVLANKPFDYTTEQTYKRIFEILRRTPQLLSHTLLQWNGRLTKSPSEHWLLPNLSEKMAKTSFVRALLRDVVGQNVPPSLDRSLSLVSSASSANPAGSSPAMFTASTVDNTITNFMVLYLVDYAKNEIMKEISADTSEKDGEAADSGANDVTHAKGKTVTWHSGKFFERDTVPAVLIEYFIRLTCRAYLDVLLTPILEWIYANEAVDLNADLQHILRRGMRPIATGQDAQQASTKPSKPTQLEHLVRVLFASIAQSEPLIPQSLKVLARVIGDLSLPPPEPAPVAASVTQDSSSQDDANISAPASPSDSTHPDASAEEKSVHEAVPVAAEVQEPPALPEGLSREPSSASLDHSTSEAADKSSASGSAAPLPMLRVSSSSSGQISLAETPLGAFVRSNVHTSSPSSAQAESPAPLSATSSSSRIHSTDAIPFAANFATRKRVGSNASASSSQQSPAAAATTSSPSVPEGLIEVPQVNTALHADPVSDLFFIHVIAAALNTPEVFGIVEASPVTPIVRTNLQLLSSILLKAAMETYYPSAYPELYEPGDSSKPIARPAGYRHGLNDLIQTYGPRFKAIAKGLTQTPSLEELDPHLYETSNSELPRDSSSDPSYDELGLYDARLVKAARFVDKALRYHVAESENTLILMCIQPNDLVSLHKVLLSVHQPTMVAPQPAYSAVSHVPDDILKELKALLAKLGPPGQYVASSGNLIVQPTGRKDTPPLTASSSTLLEVNFSEIPYIPPGGGSYLVLELSLPVLRMVSRNRQQIADEETAFWTRAIDMLQSRAEATASRGPQVGDENFKSESGQWRHLAELLMYLLSILPPLSTLSYAKVAATFHEFLAKSDSDPSSQPTQLFDMATKGLADDAKGLKGLLYSSPWLALVYAAAVVAWRQTSVSAQFTVLVEVLEALGSALPANSDPEAVSRKLSTLLSLIRNLLEERSRSTSTLVTSLALAEEQVAMVSDDLRLRERRCSNVMQQLQARRLLAHILNRLYALHKFFDHNSAVTPKQAEQAKLQHQRLCQCIQAVATQNDRALQGLDVPNLQQIVAAANFMLKSPLSAFSPLPAFELLSHVAPMCGGVFPADLASEKFICSECVRRTEKVGNVVRQFMAKYVADPAVIKTLLNGPEPTPGAGPATPSTASLYGTGSGGLVRGIAGGALPQLKLDESGPVATMATDYVIAHVSSKLLMDCPSAEYRSTVDLAVLRMLFPNFASFYLYMNQKPTLVADFALLKPFLFAVEEEQNESVTSNDSESSKPKLSATQRIELVRAQIVLNTLAHPEAHRVPFIGQNTLVQCVREVRKFLSSRSPHAKLRALYALRSNISTILNTPSVASQPPMAFSSADSFDARKDPLQLLSNAASFAADMSGTFTSFPFRTVTKEQYLSANTSANTLGIALHPQVFASLAGSLHAARSSLAEGSTVEAEGKAGEELEEDYNRDDCFEDEELQDLDAITANPSSLVPADAIWYSSKLGRDSNHRTLSYDQALRILKSSSPNPVSASTPTAADAEPSPKSSSSSDLANSGSQTEGPTESVSSAFSEADLAIVREKLATTWRPGYQGSAEDYMLVLCYVLICAQPKRLLTTVTFLRLMLAATTSMKSYIDLTVAVKCLQTTVDRLREAARRVHTVLKQEGINQARERLAQMAQDLGFKPHLVEKGLSFMSLTQLASPPNQALEILIEILTSPAFASN